MIHWLGGIFIVTLLFAGGGDEANPYRFFLVALWTFGCVWAFMPKGDDNDETN